MKKRAISQIVSTILLIALVVAIAIIIIIWSRGITGEVITIQGQSIILTCNDVIFDFSYSSGTLFITNDGNVPIYGMTLVIYSDKDSTAQNIRDLSANWPENGLEQGGAFSDSITFDAGVTKVDLIPILKGETDKGKEKEYICEYNGYTFEIN